MKEKTLHLICSGKGREQGQSWRLCTHGIFLPVSYVLQIADNVEINFLLIIRDLIYFSGIWTTIIIAITCATEFS